MKHRGWKHFGSERVVENPYYHDIRSAVAQQSVRQRVAGYLLGGFGTITLMLIIFFHPILRIRSLSVSGAQRSFIPQVQQSVETILSKKQWGIVPNNHYFFYPKTEIEQAIQTIVYAQDINVSPQWGGILSIQITPYPITLYWHSQGQYYTVNKLGIITEQIPKIEQASVIVEDIGRAVAIGKQIISADQVDWILGLVGGLNTSMSVQPDRLILSTTDPTIVQMNLYELQITFDMQQPVGPQILRFKVFLDSKPQSFRQERHFIDLRFKEKIYYE